MRHSGMSIGSKPFTSSVTQSRRRAEVPIMFSSGTPIHTSDHFVRRHLLVGRCLACGEGRCRDDKLSLNATLGIECGVWEGQSQKESTTHAHKFFLHNASPLGWNDVALFSCLGASATQNIPN